MYLRRRYTQISRFIFHVLSVFSLLLFVVLFVIELSLYLLCGQTQDRSSRLTQQPKKARIKKTRTQKYTKYKTEKNEKHNKNAKTNTQPRKKTNASKIYFCLLYCFLQHTHK